MGILLPNHVGHINFKNCDIIKKKDYLMKKAFTMMELIFVIVIIGIISAVAVPKFSETAKIAQLSKANSIYMNIVSALATERQHRILKGDFTAITDLGDSTYAFNKFDTDGTDILAFPIENCASGGKSCWERDSSDATKYSYTFVDGTDAKFKLDKSKLICDNDAADCAKIIQ